MSRGPSGPDPFLPWKIGTFVAGAVLGLLGMALDERWLVWVALAVLAAGFVLAAWGRLAERRRERTDEQARTDEEESRAPGPGA